MVKIILFVAVVFFSVLGVLMAANQPKSTLNLPDLSLSTSPTIIPSDEPNPSLTPPSTDSASVTPQTTPIQAKGAVITTSKGNIEVTFYPQEAPKTVENFLSKAQSGFYKNLTFHRVEDWVIQGGDPLGNGTGGGKMLTELNDKPFVVGSLGVARGPDIKVSNDAQFFITKKDSSHLNGQYTNFGMVTKGMDVVEKIAIGDKILGIQILQ